MRNHPVAHILVGMRCQPWRPTLIANVAGWLVACGRAADSRQGSESGIDSTRRTELRTLVADDQERRGEIPRAVAPNDPVFLKPLLAGDSVRTARLKASDVAMLADRVLVRSGKPQRYGNSFETRDGRLVAHPIEDPAGLDARRAAVGLPPMADSVQLLAAAYKQPVEWPPR